MPNDHPLVLLTWLDAHSPNATTAVSVDEVDKIHAPITITTIGWVLRDDVNGVTIASEHCGDGDYRNCTFVLRSLVMEMKPVRTPRKRPTKAISPPFSEGLN